MVIKSSWGWRETVWDSEGVTTAGESTGDGLSCLHQSQGPWRTYTEYVQIPSIWSEKVQRLYNSLIPKVRKLDDYGLMIFRWLPFPEDLKWVCWGTGAILSKLRLLCRLWMKKYKHTWFFCNLVRSLIKDSFSIWILIHRLKIMKIGHNTKSSYSWFPLILHAS